MSFDTRGQNCCNVYRAFRFILFLNFLKIMKPHNFTRLFTLAIVAFFGAIMISGCKSDSTGTTTPTNVTPKSGSSYTYTKHEKDSTSGQTPVTSDSTIVAIVVASGSYEGKANVVTLYDDFDTLHYQIENNNDVSIYLKQFGTSGFMFNNPTPWMTLPFVTKKTGVYLFATD